MMNFSPFSPGSEGLVTTAGLGLSFSGTGFAAHRNPRPKKRVKEMIRKMRIDLLYLDFIIPPKMKNSSPPSLPLLLKDGRVALVHQILKKIKTIWILIERKM
jgi:hypothetical protein